MELFLIRVTHNSYDNEKLSESLFIATNKKEIVEKVNSVRSCLYDQCDIDKLFDYKSIKLTSFDYSGDFLFVEILDSTQIGA